MPYKYWELLNRCLKPSKPIKRRHTSVKLLSSWSRKKHNTTIINIITRYNWFFGTNTGWNSNDRGTSSTFNWGLVSIESYIYYACYAQKKHRLSLLVVAVGGLVLRRPHHVTHLEGYSVTSNGEDYSNSSATKEEADGEIFVVLPSQDTTNYVSDDELPVRGGHPDMETSEKIQDSSFNIITTSS